MAAEARKVTRVSCPSAKEAYYQADGGDDLGQDGGPGQEPSGDGNEEALDGPEVIVLEDEEVDDKATPIVMRVPRSPTQAEREAHEATHVRHASA